MKVRNMIAFRSHRRRKQRVAASSSRRQPSKDVICNAALDCEVYCLTIMKIVGLVLVEIRLDVVGSAPGGGH